MNCLIATGSKQSSNKDELLTKLQELVKYDKKHNRIQDEDWSIQTGLSRQEGKDCFGNWLLTQFDSDMDRPGDVAAVLGRLADDLVREIEADKHKKTSEAEQ